MQPARVVRLQAEPPARAPLLAASSPELAAALDRADAARYGRLAHLPSCLDELGVAGRRVLEVGFGHGAEAELLVRRGARYSGLDIDPEAVELVAARLRSRGLTYDALRHGDAGDLPWPDHSFDVVFAHGLLDRVDDVEHVQAELRRVLLPGGQLVVMVRARRSWHYHVSLRIRRRDIAWGEHTDRAPRQVFTRRQLAAALPSFTVTRVHQHLAPNALGGLSRWFGWHLWAHLTPRH